MSIPSTEARVAAQERLTLVLSARIEELAQDLKQDNKLLFEHVQKGFDQAHSYIQENIESRLAITATKDDLTAMEARIMAAMDSKFDAIKQLLQQKSGE